MLNKITPVPSSNPIIRLNQLVFRTAGFKICRVDVAHTQHIKRTLSALIDTISSRTKAVFFWLNENEFNVDFLLCMANCIGAFVL